VYCKRKDLQRWVSAGTEDREWLGEWAKEGRIGLKEEVAKANCEFLGLEDLFQRG
jgi:hypothetical protein